MFRQNYPGMNFISYEQFGVNFVALAVSEERVKASVADVAGDSFHIGPMGAGPGGVAVVQADGDIGSPVVEEVPGPPLKYTAKLPITLNLEVRLAAMPQRYRGDIVVPLSLSVRTAEPLMLLIEVEPVVPRDVNLDLRSSGMSAVFFSDSETSTTRFASRWRASSISVWIRKRRGPRARSTSRFSSRRRSRKDCASVQQRERISLFLLHRSPTRELPDVARSPIAG